MMRRSSLAERAVRVVREREHDEEAKEQCPTFEDTVFPDIRD